MHDATMYEVAYVFRALYQLVNMLFLFTYVFTLSVGL